MKKKILGVCILFQLISPKLYAFNEAEVYDGLFFVFHVVPLLGLILAFVGRYYKAARIVNYIICSAMLLIALGLKSLLDPSGESFYGHSLYLSCIIVILLTIFLPIKWPVKKSEEE